MKSANRQRLALILMPPVWVRWLLTGSILMMVLAWVDHSAIWALWQQADPLFLLLALGLSVIQVALSAWRWCYTAGCLSLPLSWPRATAEYYLSTLLNQLLPGGVLGDAGRALRHGAGLSTQNLPLHRAVHAVIIERLSGQLVLFPVIVLGLTLTPAGQTLAQALTHSLFQIPEDRSIMVRGLLGLLPPVLLVLALRVLFRRAAERLGRDLRIALLRWPALAWQVMSSLCVIATYIGMYVLAAKALQIDTPFATMLPLIPVVLLAMLVPFTISGWGVRESVAAGVWALMGLPTAEGVAISVTYGLLVLVGSLPGVLTFLWHRKTDQRAT